MSCFEQTGRACPLCPGISDVDLFSYREGVIDLNAEVSDGAFDLGVTEQELHGPLSVLRNLAIVVDDPVRRCARPATAPSHRPSRSSSIAPPKA
jgi:hypothetical protein